MHLLLEKVITDFSTSFIVMVELLPKNDETIPLIKEMSKLIGYFMVKSGYMEEEHQRLKEENN